MLKIIIVTLFYIYLVYFLSQNDLGDKREQLVFILNGEKKNFLIEKKIKPPSDAATWFLASDKQAQMHHVQQYIVILFLY